MCTLTKIAIKMSSSKKHLYKEHTTGEMGAMHVYIYVHVAVCCNRKTFTFAC